MLKCHYLKVLIFNLFLFGILLNFVLCPLPPTLPQVRTVIRIVINLPEQPFNDEMYKNNSQQFKSAANYLTEAIDQFWNSEAFYKGSDVLKFRYQQVFGTMATINLKFDFPLNSSTAVVHRLKWELLRALKDGRIDRIHTSGDGFEFTPIEGPFSSPTIACPDNSMPEFSIHGSTYCWSHSVCPSGTACEHGQCCKIFELSPRRKCDPLKEWECADGGLCIPISARCDGREDCILDVEGKTFALGMLLHRSSDELYCPTGKCIFK